MRQYRFLQLDVFTDRAFSGNPLAVFPEADGLTDEEMQQIAREMNLSETVFVLPSLDEKSLRRLRIFTPWRELPFAGHPIVGTWNALAREGVVPVPGGGDGWTRIEHEVGIGRLPVDVEFKEGEPVSVVMTQGKFETLAGVEDAHERAEVERGLGLAPEDFDDGLPIQTISTGIPTLAVPLRSLDALGRCRVNAMILSEAYTHAGALSCYAFTRETIEGGTSQAHARLFAHDSGIPEDPATGSAAGSLAGYLVHHGVLNADETDGLFRFRIEQGDFIHRPSRINAEVKGASGVVEQVRIGGPSVVVARGELIF
ncbi:MAG TPA: PhzF family phenazine biosynthesis protein [Pyrinomonadaceae bacterium]|jgi:trans-2,3-dihydro-3-hydroxyanthranilate isomerase